MKIKFYGFPWQYTNQHWANKLNKSANTRYGWNPFSVKGMGRFGGGWAFKLGITLSASLKDIILELGIGAIRLTIK